MKKLEITMRYKDMQLGRSVDIGEIIEVDDLRAVELLENPNGLVRLVEQVEPISIQEYDLSSPLKTPKEFHASLDEDKKIKEDKPAKIKKTGLKKKVTKKSKK